MRKRRKNDYHQNPILEELIRFVFKPSKLLFVAILIVLIGSIIFRYDFFPVYTKIVNYLYVEKVMGFMSDVLMKVLPH
ncbi:MAG: hypothetical protein RLY66_328 [Candidatus Parcubacteria bacterium]|jgi:hypothetical protein